MKKIALTSSLSLLALCAGLLATDARAQAWTSTYASATATGTCTGLSAALATDFTVEPVVSRALFATTAPLRIGKMAFHMNAGKADIYMTEKGGATGSPGRVLYYDATANTLTSLGIVPNVFLGNSSVEEQGVWGIALNQQTFAQDNFLYVFYSYGSGANASATNGWRVSRFKLSGSPRMIDTTSEKVVLFIPAGNASRWHTGGSLRFDNFGNLYITMGDNEALAMGPGNTADLRGGILRIKIDTTDPRGYKIPAGNFGEYWAQQWEAKGLTARAAAYRDTAQVKPEIYIKGSRNPYSFGLDPNRLGWVQWSECGPDAQRNEEHNFTTKPVFSGWPFWAGNAVRQTAKAGSYDEPNEPTTWGNFVPSTIDTAVPVNNHAPALGVDTLPPMHRPVYFHTSGCAQGGPFIRYDGRVNNANKMPPHLDNTIMFTNYSTGNGNIWAAKVNPTTGAIVDSAFAVFSTTAYPRTNAQPNLRSSVDFQQGPDGMLYMVNWGTGTSSDCCDGYIPANNEMGIARVKYTGTCQDPGLFPAPTGLLSEKLLPRGSVDWLKVGTASFLVSAQGQHEAVILDMKGRSLYHFRGEGPRNYAIPQELASGGVYMLRVKTAEGTAVRSLLAGF